MTTITKSLAGLHHVTAMVSDPQQTIDFYTDVLGLRMVKQTVNFDDPGTYHLYFGDELGRPGSILTFFPWVGIRPGSSGSGLVSAVALAVPESALAYWAERLGRLGIHASDPTTRLGQQVIALYDPAGLLLELVAQPGADQQHGWTGGPVPAVHTIRSMAGVTLTAQRPAATAAFLKTTLGLTHAATEDNRSRYLAGDGSTFVDVVGRPDLPYGNMGAGSVHHIAWRVADDEQQQSWRSTLQQHGVQVTPVRDRQYFRSIYFQEPGGVLFEIATDTPGFAIDEPLDQLGTRLMLPPWLQPQRERIARTLPPINLPTVQLEPQQHEQKPA